MALYLRAEIATETIELSKVSEGYNEHLMWHIKKCDLFVANVLYYPPGTDLSRLFTDINSLTSPLWLF